MRHYKGERTRPFRYGDNCSSFVRSFEISGGQATNETDWASKLSVSRLTSFGVDARNEIYITGAGVGEVVKIMPPFTDLQVSGAGAADLFRLNRDGNWTWED